MHQAAFAGPEGGEVIGGDGTITYSDDTTTILQESDNLAIDWDSFDVGSDESVYFIQPDSDSIALNNILSNHGSTILGNINANGHVILVNPNGVIFGSGSSVNAGGLIASGLRIDPNDFMNGDYVFSAVDGSNGFVLNQGLINAAMGGSVALIGTQVENEGVISAQLGAITLAAGKEAVVSFDQEGLLGVTVTEAVLQEEIGIDAAVVNSGEINAESGQVLLTASVSQEIFSAVVNAGEMRNATSVVMDSDGGFTLSAGGNVETSGDINVSGSEAGNVVILGENISVTGDVTANASDAEYAGLIEIHSRDTTMIEGESMIVADADNGVGGDIKLLGANVGVMDSAIVSASGAVGGGQLLVGGDETGSNPLIPNADFIYIGEDVNLHTDALTLGDGGKLITFAENTARIYGHLSSVGGALGGNGGFVETSGLNSFDILQTPDIAALSSSGDSGTWLIDPYNVDIVGSSSPRDITNTSPFTPSANDRDLDVDLIINALSVGNNVTVIVNTGSSGTQEGNITIDSDIDYNISGDNGSETEDTATLQLDAAGSIIFNSGDDIELASGGGGTLNVVLNAGSNITLNNNALIDTNGGYLQTFGVNLHVDDNNSSAADIYAFNTHGGDVTLNQTGTVRLERDINSSGGDISISGSALNLVDDNPNGAGIYILDSGSGDITLDITGAVQIDRGINTNGGDLRIRGTTLNITNTDSVATDAGNIYAITTNTGDVYIHNSGAIDLDRGIITNGGDILIGSEVVSPATPAPVASSFNNYPEEAELNVESITGGGDISILSTGEITLGNVELGDTDDLRSNNTNEVANITFTAGTDFNLRGTIDYESTTNADVAIPEFSTILTINANNDINIGSTIPAATDVGDFGIIDNNSAGINPLTLNLNADNDASGEGDIIIASDHFNGGGLDTNIYLGGGSLTATGVNFTIGRTGDDADVGQINTEGGNVYIYVSGAVNLYENDQAGDWESTSALRTAGGNVNIGQSASRVASFNNYSGGEIGTIDTEANAADDDSGNVTIYSSGSVTLGNITTSNGASCGSGTELCGNLTIDALGAISDGANAVLAINGSTLINAPGQTITFDSTTNDFNNFGVTSALDLYLIDSNAIALNSITVTGDNSENGTNGRLYVTTNDSISQNTSTTISSTNGGDVVLVANADWADAVGTATVLDVDTNTTDDSVSAGSVFITGSTVDITNIDTSATGATANAGSIEVTVHDSFDLDSAAIVVATSTDGTAGSFTVNALDDGDAGSTDGDAETITLNSGASWTGGAFTLNGNDGVDTFYLGAAFELTVNAGAGYDDIYITNDFSGTVNGDNGWDDFFIQSTVTATLHGLNGLHLDDN